MIYLVFLATSFSLRVILPCLSFSFGNLKIFLKTSLFFSSNGILFSLLVEFGHIIKKSFYLQISYLFFLFLKSVYYLSFLFLKSVYYLSFLFLKSEKFSGTRSTKFKFSA